MNADEARARVDAEKKRAHEAVVEAETAAHDVTRIAYDAPRGGIEAVFAARAWTFAALARDYLEAIDAARGPPQERALRAHQIANAAQVKAQQARAVLVELNAVRRVGGAGR